MVFKNDAGKNARVSVTDPRRIWISGKPDSYGHIVAKNIF